MKESRLETTYKNGVEQFLAFAYQNLPPDSEILCPCINCKNRYNHSCNEVRTHLRCDGIIKGYTTWVHHGEKYARPLIALADVPNIAGNLTTSGPIRDHQDRGSDGMQELLHAAFGRIASMSSVEEDDIQSGSVDVEHNGTEDHVNPMEGDALGRQLNIYASLLKDADAGIFSGCKYSRLSFLVHLYHVKCLYGWSQESFTTLLEIQNIYASLLKDADAGIFSGCKYSRLSFLVHLYHVKCLYGWSQESFTTLLEIISSIPGANLPKTYYEAKKIISDLGLDYMRIHACPNDCILFRGKPKGKRKPAKVLRYFPLIPRIQRLFSTTKTSDDMRWHDDGRTKEEKLRHPADGDAWKDFNDRNPDFAEDPRNIRLGLASDGFNPFGNKNLKHSTWPVMLVPYNLPPWICMKQTSLIMSMIIPGPKSPGNDVDVYLQPLIDELLLLWAGVGERPDASSKKKFTLQAALFWTINDFPALAYLYGWSTGGRYACPSCGPAPKSFT
ncbi:uncharacterized protein LOC110430009 isoform X2 [Sorghum bicolor]|uniref:uncharacterized protein LOC110430009 isoform X2 n=1 Tax=Sorghum bicolor TaxID=4558 RepID=UPI000B4254EB|nr:uncharacterized protein LOC110430009 isoform X2 [Sorghum bicolor]|eukprot:XP_021302502.1 uncharacterized protein LOC110430009 isoform X2 [Sorghum bicolor]